MFNTGGGVIKGGGVFNSGGGVFGGGVFCTSEPTQPHEMLADLEALLQEQFKFEIFAPGAINFGINVTYRQRWEPITYQVGNLVKTITLAPKESRKVSTKHTLRKERAVASWRTTCACARTSRATPRAMRPRSSARRKARPPSATSPRAPTTTWKCSSATPPPHSRRTPRRTRQTSRRRSARP